MAKPKQTAQQYLSGSQGANLVKSIFIELQPEESASLKQKIIELNEALNFEPTGDLFQDGKKAVMVQAKLSAVTSGIKSLSQTNVKIQGSSDDLVKQLETLNSEMIKKGDEYSYKKDALPIFQNLESPINDGSKNKAGGAKIADFRAAPPTSRDRKDETPEPAKPADRKYYDYIGRRAPSDAQRSGEGSIEPRADETHQSAPKQQIFIASKDTPFSPRHGAIVHTPDRIIDVKTKEPEKKDIPNKNEPEVRRAELVKPTLSEAKALFKKVDGNGLLNISDGVVSKREIETFGKNAAERERITKVLEDAGFKIAVKAERVSKEDSPAKDNTRSSKTISKGLMSELRSADKDHDGDVDRKELKDAAGLAEKLKAAGVNPSNAVKYQSTPTQQRQADHKKTESLSH